MALTTRANGQEVDASWFNDIKSEIENATLTVTAVTTTYPVAAGDKLITGDATGGAFDVTLPPLSGNEGKNYIVKKIDASANAVTVEGNGSETIDGALNVVLPSRYDNIWVIAGASEWHVIAKWNDILVNQELTTPDINGGTATSLTNLAIRSTGAAFDLTLATLEALTTTRILRFNVNDADRVLTIEADSIINQDLSSDATPTFAGITNDSADINITTTTSGDITLDSADDTIVISSADDTSATTQTVKFGDDTGGVTAIRNNSGTMQFNSSGAGWLDMGSGSGEGGGGINYITNGDAETDTTGWTRYKNTTPGVSPDDFGGTPDAVNVTWTRSTSVPLRGDANFLWTVDAANNQGEGVYYDFTLENADLARSMYVTLEAATAAGVLDGDIRIYLVSSSDSFVANFNLIETVPVELLAGDGVYSAHAQTDATDTEYRLCIHQAGTTATATSTKFDTITLGPDVINFGQAAEPLESYTPTTQGFGTISAINMYKARSREWREVVGDFTGGTMQASEGRIYLPAGEVISSKFNSVNTQVGTFITNDSGDRYHLLLAKAGDNYVTLGTVNVTTGTNKLTIESSMSAIFNSSKLFTVNFRVPIEGWGVTAQLADVDSARVVSMLAQGNADTIGASAVINFSASLDETHNGYLNGVYTIPSSGRYDISSAIETTATTGAAFRIYIDGVNTFEKWQDTVSRTINVLGVYLNKGQTVDIRNNSALTMSALARQNWFSITKNQGNQQSMVGEKILVKCSDSSGITVDTSSPDILFANKIFDNHNAFNISTGYFTSPRAETYRVTAVSRLGATSGFGRFEFRKNGATETYGPHIGSNGTHLGIVHTDLIQLNKDETFNTKGYSSVSTTMNGSAEMNTLTIESV